MRPGEKITQTIAGDDFLSKVKASTPNDGEILSGMEAKKNIVKIRSFLIAQNSSSRGVLGPHTRYRNTKPKKDPSLRGDE